MAMSVPHPKRASAISFLDGGATDSSFLMPGGISGSSGVSEDANLGDWRSSANPALDSLSFDNGPLMLDSTASEASLLDSVIQKSITPSLTVGAERVASTPADQSLGVWGQAKPTLTGENWDLSFSPPGLLDRSVSSLGFNHTLDVTATAHRPLSTPITSTFDNLDGHLKLNQNAAVGLFSDSASIFMEPSTKSALDALNGIGHLSLGDQECWPKPVRYGNTNSLLEYSSPTHMNTFSSPGLHSLGSTSPLDGMVCKAPNNSANFLERTPSAIGFDGYGGYGHLRNSTPLGNLGGLLTKSFTPTSTPAHLLNNLPAPNHGASQTSAPASSTNKLSLQNVDERAVENVVANNCQQILLDAMYHSLKAVELANTLRARVGTEILAMVREKWGGLLSLLERHPTRFLVERIPKNDRVSLVNFPGASATATSSATSAVGPSSTSAVVMEASSSSSLPGGNGVGLTMHSSTLRTQSPLPLGEGVAGDTLSMAGASMPMNSVATTGMDKETTGDDHNELDEEDLANASRCLHVGNVPVGYTEVQLMKEFEKFGTLEGLKLISQKNNVRRFAFVTYKTVAQAVTAKLCLSKSHPWKSAISFAHKDMSATQASGPGIGQSNAVGHHPHGHMFGHHSHSMNTGMGGSNSNANVGGGGYGHFNGFKHANPTHPHSHAHAHGHSHGHGHSQGHGHGHGHAHGHAHGHGHGHGNGHGHTLPPHLHVKHSGHARGPTAMHTMGLQHRTTSPNYSYLDAPHLLHHPPSPHLDIPVMNDADGFPHPHSRPVSMVIKDPAILHRLCDDTYVPTQPWPIDAHNDALLIGSIQQQLMEFNGTTTISKLRGYLKHRIGVSDNIKSVPLKALLLAYPHYFLVDGNIVSILKTAA